MCDRFDVERKAHIATCEKLLAITKLLGEARTALDKAKIERARLILTIRDRDEECDSLRNMVAELARMAGGGSVL